MLHIYTTSPDSQREAVILYQSDESTQVAADASELHEQCEHYEISLSM
jgi:hypothetical protein